MSKAPRLLTSALVAFVMACASVLAGLVPAQAATTIDPTKLGSLTINKYLGAANTSLPHDGSALTPAQISQIGATPLSGIAFDVYKVGNIDLTTNQGWIDAKALQAHTITQAEITAGQIVVNGTTYTLTKVTAPTPATTNTAGQLVFSDLAIGLYLVNENLTTSTYAEKSSLTPSNPFLVTVPISYVDPTDSTKDTWVYDINVYPKNSKDSITKQALDGNIGTANQDAPKVGTNLTYRLTSSIVAAADYNADGSINGSDIGMYVVGDNLSPYVTYKSATLSIVKPDGTLVTALTAGTDYTVTGGAAAGDPVKFTFTTAGLNKLMAAKLADPTVVVRTDIVAEVTSLPATGLVPNTAYFIPSQGWYNSNTNPDNGVPSNTVTSKYGDISIKKVDSAGTLLNGAVFSLYRDPVLGGNCSTLTPAWLADAANVPLMTSTATAAGYTQFSGLQLSNWYNDGVTSGSITDTALYHNYCLVETKAPTGYQLLAQPVSVSLTTVGVTAAVATDGQVVTVTNMPDNLANNLPLTGGEGVAAVGLAGLLLVGGGLGYYMVARRKEDSI